MSDQTVGSKALELASKDDGSITPMDIAESNEQEYINNIIWCVEHAQKKVSCRVNGRDACNPYCKDRASMDGDIFVDVEVRTDLKPIGNVIRAQFIPKLTCPSPRWDHSVFHYEKNKETISYLWSIPPKEWCEYYLKNPDLVPMGQEQMFLFIKSFYNGSLFEVAYKLNGEIKGGEFIQSPILEVIKEG